MQINISVENDIFLYSKMIPFYQIKILFSNFNVNNLYINNCQ